MATSKPTDVLQTAVVPVRSRQSVLYALVILLGTVFGLQYASARMMGLAAVEPLAALFFIHLGLSAGFVAVLCLSGKLFRPTLSQLLFFTVVSLFANLGQLGIELMAAHHVPAGELTLIVSLLPVFVLVIVALFRTEPVTLRKAGGILLGVAASTTILLPSALGNAAPFFWVAITFIAPISQAIGMVVMAQFWPGKLEPFQVATGNLVVGSFLLLPLVLGSGDTLRFHPTSAGNIATLLFAFTMAAEFYIFAVLLRRGGATVASCADFIAICAGLLFGYLLFSEVPTIWMVAAALLCLLALRFAADRPA